MKTKKQNTDFVHVGKRLIAWYEIHGRDLPFRKTRDPYPIWICEIIFQQTRISQGLQHYENFMARFGSLQALAEADSDEVLLYWKGLGYYSRALNLHRAAQQIMEKHGGVFPQNYEEVLSLPGIGKYTAAAICSICFGTQLPAVDGNLYRVLSRFFADDFDISSSQAFTYFSQLACRLMPAGQAGAFNEAMMDLGSQICRPRQPLCSRCPLQEACLAFQLGQTGVFPVKLKRAKVTELELSFFFVEFDGRFLARRRGTDFIWKKLYEFPTDLAGNLSPYINDTTTVYHKLTHRNLTITFHHVCLRDEKTFNDFAQHGNFIPFTYQESGEKSFPKPLQNYLAQHFGT